MADFLDKLKKKEEERLGLGSAALNAIAAGANAAANAGDRRTMSVVQPVTYAPVTSTTAQRLYDVDSRISDYTYKQFVESDDYASLVKRYSKQGLRAMDDTLGRVAARTGGIASSYAATAAQQANLGYMTELENIARQMYGENVSELKDERAWLYDMQQQEKAEKRQQQNDTLDLFKLGISLQESKDAKDKAAEQEQYDRNVFLADLLAKHGDYSGYAQLGLTEEQIANMQKADEDARAAAAAGKVTEEKPKLTASQVVEALDNGIRTPEVQAAYEYYYGAGSFESSKYNNPAKPEDKGITDDELYEQVYDALIGTGSIAGKGLAKLLPDPEEWKTDKQGYDSYAEFLEKGLEEQGIDIGAVLQNKPSDSPASAQQPATQAGDYVSSELDKARTTAYQLIPQLGKDVVYDLFLDKPEELTEEEWQDLLRYIDSL